MAKVQHYMGLKTNLDKLYNDIKQLLEDQKDLQIVSEYKGTLNAVPPRFQSVSLQSQIDTMRKDIAALCETI